MTKETIIPDTLALIGNTPLVRLKGPSEAAGADIYGKCEFANPGASVKDRAALWIVRDSVPEGLVYGITRALFNPANRDALSASHPSAREIGLTTAALMPPAPLHPGAARFYADAARAAQR